mgnify:CR=1 FL=1
MGYHLLKTYGRPVKQNRRKSRAQVLHEYVQNTDTVWKDDLYKMGFNNISMGLASYTRNHNIQFIKIDEKCWEIVKPTF